ncbi:MAG: hypothetical protein ACI9KS_000053 [Sulfitobacter sp.]|jgi:hypothetical protein
MSQIEITPYDAAAHTVGLLIEAEHTFPNGPP